MLKDLISNSYSINPDTYDTYYLKPDYDISNKNNISIANSFAYTYKPLVKRLGVNLKNTKVEFPKQIYFTTILKKSGVGFYISIPREYNLMIKGKMHTVWPKSEIRPEESPPVEAFNNPVVGELIQKDYNFKSLDCTTGNLYPLTNLLGIIKSLQEHEEVRITLVLESYGKFNWIENSKDQLTDYKQGKKKNVEKSRGEKLFDTGIKIADSATDIFIDINSFILDATMGLFLGDSKVENTEKDLRVTINDKAQENQMISGLSKYTRYKLNSEVFKARILITSTGENKDKSKLNIMSVANSFRDLQGDNELILKVLSDREASKLVVDINSRLVKVGKRNIFSDKEVAKFIQMPQKDLQSEYKLDRIDTRQVDIPNSLQGGNIRIGVAEQLGKDINCTFSENINVAALPKVLIGPQGVGKTTALKRIVKDSYKAKQSNIVIDVIEDCDTAKEVMEVVEYKDRVVITIGTKDYIQSLAYTEVSKFITEDLDVYERVRLADLIADQVEYLIDAVSGERITELTVPMMRYLHSACLITFIKPMTTLADVFKVLRDYRYRTDMVAYAKHSRCFRLDDEIFLDMEELDKKNSKGKVEGTREDLIIGIINRISMLQKNRTVKEMLSAPIDQTQDFARYIEEGKQIFILIPQNKIPSQSIRDIISTYFVTRLWLTVQLRESNKNARLCNLIFDEVRIVPTTTSFISNHITEFRRHRLGTIFTCHYLKQFNQLLTALKSSGASYIILAGTEKENVEALKQEILPFTIEEVLQLKEHTSLNVIKSNSSEYARFVAKQPKL